MPGSLDHSPAEVVRRLLIQEGLGSDPADPPGTWPVYANGEPDTPDSAITVYNTQGRDGGRTMTDGERQEHHGVQVRIRAAAFNTGFSKARAIAVSMDEDIVQEFITIGSASYKVWSISRSSDVLFLGNDTPTSKRKLFTINALVSLRQVA